MATDYTIDPRLGLIRINYSGRVTVSEMYERRRHLMADLAYDRAFSQLIDARSVITFEMNGFTIKRFAEEHVAAAGARRAIVMSRAPDLGLARMFQIYRELAGGPEVTQIFDDIGKAIAWLGLPNKYNTK